MYLSTPSRNMYDGCEPAH